MEGSEPWGTTTNAMASMVETTALLVPGTLLGERFRIVTQLGAGGMGVVYRARDEQLARDVAIKVHARGSGSDRLLREATAMAQLSHPNVVTVYEVGQHEKAIFIAMELIEGETARAWARDHKRGWRDVLRLYLAAGEGLAAMHAAGLIHRDFKPENILVGKDGRVRVADLGLARAAGDQPPGDARLAASPGSSAAGTPAYMSPEQRAGGEVDERADQYAFAASVSEALSDLRPPRRIRRALRRALAETPVDRWPSLAAMLGALGRSPRLLYAALAGTALAAGAALVISTTGASSDQCGGGPERFQPAWNPGVRASLQSALARSEYGKVWPEVEHALDGYQQTWLGMHREACETHARGEQSPQILDQRMICLDRRLEEVKLLTALLTTPGTPLKRTRTAVLALTPVDVCGDIAALTAETPPAENPQTRAAVSALSAVDAQAKALNFTGQWEAARDLLLSIEEHVRALGYSPLVGDIEYHLAAAHERLGQFPQAEAAFRKSLYAAEEGRSDKTAALALTSLTRVVGLELHRYPEAHQLALQAEAAIKRLHRPWPEMEVEHVQNLALLYNAEGNLEEGLKTDRRMLVLAERVYGPNDFHVAVAATNLGGSIQRSNPESPASWAESLPFMERALRITESAGREPSALADMNLNLGSALAGIGKLDEAKAHFEKALTLGEAGLPAGHPHLSEYHLALADLRQITGDFPGALTSAETAAAILLAALGDKAPELVQAHGRVADALVGLGRYREALIQVERARAIDAAQPPSLLTVWSTTIAGRAHLGLAHPREAAKHLEQALALAPKVTPSLGVVGLAPTRFALAQVRWGEGKTTEALELAASARDGFSKDPIPKLVALADVEAWIAAHARPR